MTEQLSQDELAYHNQVIANLNASQIALNSWGAHLRAKYVLKEKDNVTLDGKIVRDSTTKKE